MMNLLALALILSSIAAASFFSPPPNPDHQLLREGHRLILLEFERHIPQPPSFASSAAETNEKPLDSASIQDLSQPPKEKLSSVFTDTKNKAAQLEESASDAVHSFADKIKHKAAQIEESASVALKQKASKAAEDVAGNLSAVAATDIVQRAWELGREAAAFVGAGAAKTARSAAAVAHLLGFATAYGTCVWVTFASNHVLASAIPRQQFGIVQSRIYPVYFRFLAVAVGVGLVGHMLRGEERVQGYNLMAMLAIVLLNLIWLEPKATKAMFERMKLEKEEGRGRDIADVGSEPAMPRAGTATATATATTTTVADALTTRKEVAKGRMSEVMKKLKWLNKFSSFLNVLTLMGLSWHLVHIA